MVQKSGDHQLIWYRYPVRWCRMSSNSITWGVPLPTKKVPNKGLVWDPLLKIQESWWRLLMGRGTTQSIASCVDTSFFQQNTVRCNYIDNFGGKKYIYIYILYIYYMKKPTPRRIKDWKLKVMISTKKESHLPKSNLKNVSRLGFPNSISSS